MANKRNYTRKALKKLFFSQTQDDLQQIIFSGTLEEVAYHYGVKPQSIRKVIHVYNKNGWKWCPYGCVSYDDYDFEEGEVNGFYTDLSTVSVLGTNMRGRGLRRITKGSKYYDKVRGCGNG